MNNQPPQSGYAAGGPVMQLKANRNLLRYILLGIVTLGIYQIVYFSVISSDINIIAGRYDGRRTMHYCLLIFLLTPITFGVAAFVWFHRISGRIGDELARRNLSYTFGASDFWLWYVLGSLIVVGPFIYVYRLSNAFNLLAEDYNVKG